MTPSAHISSEVFHVGSSQTFAQFQQTLSFFAIQEAMGFVYPPVLVTFCRFVFPDPRSPTRFDWKGETDRTHRMIGTKTAIETVDSKRTSKQKNHSTSRLLVCSSDVELVRSEDIASQRLSFRRDDGLREMGQTSGGDQ
mmetsp:Transcript_2139/g.14067  ORF Transcript_2139/g.14067 Transcript_2139/m.14067 type:complete len:139 (-) Transcript_2139:1275-1691(-)